MKKKKKKNGARRSDRSNPRSSTRLFSPGLQSSAAPNQSVVNIEEGHGVPPVSCLGTTTQKWKKYGLNNGIGLVIACATVVLYFEQTQETPIEIKISSDLSNLIINWYFGAVVAGQMFPNTFTEKNPFTAMLNDLKGESVETVLKRIIYIILTILTSIPDSIVTAMGENNPLSIKAIALAFSSLVGNFPLNYFPIAETSNDFLSDTRVRYPRLVNALSCLTCGLFKPVTKCEEAKGAVMENIKQLKKIFQIMDFSDLATLQPDADRSQGENPALVELITTVRNNAPRETNLYQAIQKSRLFKPLSAILEVVGTTIKLTTGFALTANSAGFACDSAIALAALFDNPLFWEFITQSTLGPVYILGMIGGYNIADSILARITDAFKYGLKTLLHNDDILGAKTLFQKVLSLGANIGLASASGLLASQSGFISEKLFDECPVSYGKEAINISAVGFNAYFVFLALRALSNTTQSVLSDRLGTHAKKFLSLKDALDELEVVFRRLSAERIVVALMMPEFEAVREILIDSTLLNAAYSEIQSLLAASSIQSHYDTQLSPV